MIGDMHTQQLTMINSEGRCGEQCEGLCSCVKVGEEVQYRWALYRWALNCKVS